MTKKRPAYRDPSPKKKRTRKPKITIVIEESETALGNTISKTNKVAGFYGKNFDSKKINKRLYNKALKELGPTTSMQHYLETFSPREKVSLILFWLISNAHKVFSPKFFEELGEKYWWFKPFDDNPVKLLDALAYLLSTGEAHDAFLNIPIELTNFDFDIVRKISFPIDSPAKKKGGTRNRYGAKAGFREDMNEYFRSASEANFARYLTLKFGLDKWEYEPDKFPIEINKIKKKTHYIPDFKVFLKDESIPTYFEVKPYFPKNYPGQKKIIAFLEKYPDNKFVLVTNKSAKVVINFYDNLKAIYPDRVSILYFDDIKKVVQSSLIWE